jgi:gliding motility-associated-like protein
MKLIPILLFLTIALSLKGQNLILNPSLENYSSCEAGMLVEYANYWYNPASITGQPFLYAANASSTDYFNICQVQNPPSNGIPQNFMGIQTPKDGMGYAGMIVYVYSPLDTQWTNYREYAVATFTDSLAAGINYCFEFFISLAGLTAGSIDEFGVYFSADSINFPTNKVIPVTPHYTTPDGLMFTDTTGWTLISMEYTAQGGEKFVCVGNFNTDSNTNIITTGIGNAYYYIDMFSLEECGPPMPGPVKPLYYLVEDIIRPNVFTPNNDGENDVFEIKNLPDSSGLKIYSRWGNLVFQSDNYQNDWNGNGLSDGVYYYVLGMPYGQSKHGTITILR